MRTADGNRRRGEGLRAQLLDWLPGRSQDAAPDPQPEEDKAALRVRRESTGQNRRRETPMWIAVSWMVPMAAATLAFSTPFLGIQMHDYLMHAGHFFVRQVVVDGNDRLDETDLLALAGIEPGTHLLSADLSDMEARLESHPWVARATVRRDLPDKLFLSITEHRAVAYVVLDDLMLVNADGAPFAVASPQDDLDIPIVSGLPPSAFDTDEAAARARSDLRAAVNLSRLYDTLGLGNRWPIGEMRLAHARNVTLVLSGTGTEIVLGSGPYRQKLYRLEWVLEKLHQEGAVAEYVLLDSAIASNPGRDDGMVIVRADLATSPEELAEEAHRRARALALEQREQERGRDAPSTAAPRTLRNQTQCEAHGGDQRQTAKCIACVTRLQAYGFDPELPEAQRCQGLATAGTPPGILPRLPSAAEAVSP